MSQFLADIVGRLEHFAMATGLLMLHRAAKEPSAPLVRVARLVLKFRGVAVGFVLATTGLNTVRAVNSRART